MKSPLSKYIAGAALLVTSSASSADQFVIAHPSVALSPGDVKDVYLGEKQFAGSVKLLPLDNASAQEPFLAKVLNLDRTKYASVWTKKAFRDGLNQPPLKFTDSEVLEFVARTPGAVGYVSAKPVGVNIIQKF